jgi:hypothetical protein
MRVSNVLDTATGSLKCILFSSTGQIVRRAFYGRYQSRLRFPNPSERHYLSRGGPKKWDTLGGEMKIICPTIFVHNVPVYVEALGCCSLSTTYLNSVNSKQSGPTATADAIPRPLSEPNEAGTPPLFPLR